jgi:hypothetical protein
VVKDERTVAVENASYRWAYLVLSYGLLLSTAYRGFVRDEASWDLLGLVLLGGAVSTFYQHSFRVLPRRWVWVSVGAVLLAVVLAAVILVAVRQ